MPDVTREQVQRLVDLAKAIDSPHVDLTPIGIPIHVGVDDIVGSVLARDVPAFSIDFGDDLPGGLEVKVSHVDGGGAIATIGGTW